MAAIGWCFPGLFFLPETLFYSASIAFSAPFPIVRIFDTASIPDKASHNLYFHCFCPADAKNKLIGSGPSQAEAPLQGKKAAASLSSVPLTAPKIRLCPSAVNGPAQIRQSPKIVPSFLCKNAPASCCGNRGVYNILLSFMLSAPHAITCGGS